MICGTQKYPVNAQSFHLSQKILCYKQLLRKRQEEGDFILNSATLDDFPSIDAIVDIPLGVFICLAENDFGYVGSSYDLMLEWVNPIFLKAVYEASKDNNPNWWEYMIGPFSDEYWKASCTEIKTLENMEAWDVVERDDKMNSIESTWRFKIKPFPYRLVNKSKYRFCYCGDHQL